jgi:hypothetical protein
MRRPPSRARRGDGKVYKRGRLWSTRWTENGERCYSGGYLTEDAANQVRAVIALNLQAGRPGLERIRPEKPEPLPTFGALVGEWLDDRKAKGRRSVDDDRRRWNRHLGLLLAHRRPDASIDAGFLDRMISNLRSPPFGQPRSEGASQERDGPTHVRLAVGPVGELDLPSQGDHGAQLGAGDRAIRPSHEPAHGR